MPPLAMYASDRDVARICKRGPKRRSKATEGGGGGGGSSSHGREVLLISVSK